MRKELAQGPVLTSAVGYSLTYNTLDNNKNPTMGLLWTFNQDFAGVGGDVNYIKTTTDVRLLSRGGSGRVGVLHLQGGLVNGWGDKDLRMLDHFQMGPISCAALRHRASVRAICPIRQHRDPGTRWVERSIGARR